MRESISITEKEVVVLIFLAMLFAICESLSIEMNNFFHDYVIFGYRFSFNVSVIFFCIGFFIIDLVTEIYNDRFANYFIYSKIISQVAFICLGVLGVKLAGIEHGQIAGTFLLAPRTLFNSMIASFIGYTVTGKIMQRMKIKFNERFLFTRYLSSTFPGEVSFSLIFTVLSFSHGRRFSDVLNIFVGLIIVKFLLSFLFSILVIPVTNILKHFLKKDDLDSSVSSMPF
ncbi:MAG: VUT family protein [Gammaproteobacteria bacterium]|nr:VUT family protein [Gammaproteobacteria bacterium]